MLSQLSRASGRVFVALALMGLPANAIELTNASIAAIENEGRWELQIGLTGTSDISDATVTLPGGSTLLILDCQAGLPAEVDCDLLEVDGGSFSSVAELLQTFPTGDYALSINAGLRTTSLPFAPVEPNGTLTNVSPADEATQVSPTPVVTYDNSCTNCTELMFFLEPFASEGFSLDFETINATSPGSILYSDWTGLAKPDQLPADRYVLGRIVSLRNLPTTLAFDQSEVGQLDFDFYTGASAGVLTFFTVPEPTAGVAYLSAVGVLAMLAAARRTSSRNWLRRGASMIP